MAQDVNSCVEKSKRCCTAKGQYDEPNTKEGIHILSIISSVLILQKWTQAGMVKGMSSS